MFGVWTFWSERASEPLGARPRRVDRVVQPVSRPRPVTLVLAVALLALQAGMLAALAVAVWLSTTGAVALALPVIGFAGAFALLVGAVAFALWRRRRWARGAGVAWSMLMALVGASQLGSNLFAAIVFVLVGLGTVAALVAPATRLALEAEDAAQPQD